MANVDVTTEIVIDRPHDEVAGYAGDPEFVPLALMIHGGLAFLVISSIAFFSRRVRRVLRLDTLLKKLPLSGVLQQIDQAIYFYRSHLKGIVLVLLASVFNHLLDLPAVSTARVFDLANSAGVPVYRIDSSNASTIVPLLTQSASIISTTLTSTS